MIEQVRSRPNPLYNLNGDFDPVGNNVFLMSSKKSLRRHRSFDVKLTALALAVALVCLGCQPSDGLPSVGSAAPNFKVASADEPSKAVQLGDFHGKVLLVDFWATWCAPCRDELPKLRDLWNSNRSKGLEMVAISQESVADIEKYKTESGSDLPFFTDADGSANKAYGIDGLPTTLLIGKDGHVLYSSVGAEMGGELDKDLVDAVAKAL